MSGCSTCYWDIFSMEDCLILDNTGHAGCDTALETRATASAGSMCLHHSSYKLHTFTYYLRGHACRQTCTNLPVPKQRVLRCRACVGSFRCTNELPGRLSQATSLTACFAVSAMYSNSGFIASPNRGSETTTCECFSDWLDQ